MFQSSHQLQDGYPFHKGTCLAVHVSFLALLVLSIIQSGSVTCTATKTAADLAGHAGHSTASILVNLQAVGRRFDGIGALSGGGGTSRLLYHYPEPQRTHVLDLLFSSGGGALDIFKVEIGGDTQSTEATEPSHMHTRYDQSYTRGYEWWLMKEAKKRNPQVQLYGLTWGVPGWVGNGTFYSNDNIMYHLNWLRGARDVHNLTIDYVGIWNERQSNDTWIVQFRRALNNAGFGHTKIVAADTTNWDIGNDMLKSPELYDAVGVIGCHYPYARTYATPAMMDMHKPLWASEEWNLGQFGDYDGAMVLAQTLNGNYIEGNMTATIVWNLVYSWYSILPFSTPVNGTVIGAGHSLMYAAEPWSGHYSVQPPLYAVAHTTHFTNPGWRYIVQGHGSGTSPGNASYVTLVSDTGTDADWTMIFETSQATASEALTIKIEASGAIISNARPVSIWRTKPGSYFQLVQTIPAWKSGDVIKLLLEPRSVYTVSTVVDKSGFLPPERFIPPSKPFPLPYADNFDNYTNDTIVRYFTAEGGSFSAAFPADGKTKGMVLEQVVRRRPIEWGQNPNPYAIAGDSQQWTQYFASVRAFVIPNPEDVPETKPLAGWPGGVYSMLCVGINSYARSGKTIHGFCLFVFATSGSHEGSWCVTYENNTLASGSLQTPVHVNTWHTLALRLENNQVVPYVDGTQLHTSIQPPAGVSEVKGMVAIGSGWHRAQFDDFLLSTVS